MQASSFATLVNSKIIVPSSSTSYYAVDKHFLTQCLGGYVRSIYVDVDWYLDRYPDVAEAINRKLVSDVHDHYTRFGYWENRMPYPMSVEEGWYVQAYADVAQAIARKAFSSGQEHFDRVGFQEGRFPHPNFELRTVATEASRPAEGSEPVRRPELA